MFWKFKYKKVGSIISRIVFVVDTKRSPIGGEIIFLQNGFGSRKIKYFGNKSDLWPYSINDLKGYGRALQWKKGYMSLDEVFKDEKV